MKKTIVFLLFTMIFACTHMPDNEYINQLIDAIPDHKFTPENKACFSEEYFNTLEEAWAIPSDAIGGIGSEEWLYYFVSGNDDPVNTEKIIGETVKKQDTLFVKFILYGENHTMKLIKEKSNWVIGDFDDTYQKMKMYIHSQRDYFRSQQWKDYLNEFDFSDADQAQKRVRSYFEKYN